MNFKKILYVALFFIVISCQKNSPEYDLEEALLALQELGQFEKANFEFLGSPEKSKSSTIKVTLENSKIKKFNQKEFGLKLAKKIYNLNKKTKEYAFVQISFKSETSKQILGPMSFLGPMSLNLNLTKNFFFEAIELK
jgi:hypothetical protein